MMGEQNPAASNIASLARCHEPRAAQPRSAPSVPFARWRKLSARLSAGVLSFSTLGFCQRPAGQSEQAFPELAVLVEIPVRLCAERFLYGIFRDGASGGLDRASP